ncbi:MAG: hypothetical protein ACRDY6_16980 [Acidimicrobiia bacterium]
MDIGAASTEAEQESTYRFINAEVSELHRQLREEAQSIDTKATLVAGFAAAAITFLLNARRGTAGWAALGTYGLTVGSAFAALWPRRWEVLVPSALETELSDAAPVVVAGQVASSKTAIYDHNREHVARKTVLWMASVATLSVSGIPSIYNTVMEGSNG